MKYLLLLLLLSSCKIVHINIDECSCIVPKQHNTSKPNKNLSPLQEAAQRAMLETNKQLGLYEK